MSLKLAQTHIKDSVRKSQDERLDLWISSGRPCERLRGRTHPDLRTSGNYVCTPPPNACWIPASTRAMAASSLTSAFSVTTARPLPSAASGPRSSTRTGSQTSRPARRRARSAGGRRRSPTAWRSAWLLRALRHGASRPPRPRRARQRCPRGARAGWPSDPVKASITSLGNAAIWTALRTHVWLTPMATARRRCDENRPLSSVWRYLRPWS